MTRTSKHISRRGFVAPLLILLAGIVVTLATTGFSSPASQRNGNLQITQFHHVIITGEDIRDLPSGEHHIIQKMGGGDGGTEATPTGTVRFVIDGVTRNTSAELTRTGAGHLILPNTNNGAGVTKVGPGTLQNSANSSTNLVKELTGTLVLSATSGVVYEFRDLGSKDFGQVVVPTEDKPTEQVSFPFGNIRTSVQHDRPAGGMKGWPFARLLIGPAKGIAQVEGWKSAKTTSPAPVSKYVCSGRFCQCIGTADCLGLTNSGSCTSDMNCDGNGDSTKCYCTK